jgi:hypothetical protein
MQLIGMLMSKLAKEVVICKDKGVGYNIFLDYGFKYDPNNPLIEKVAIASHSLECIAFTRWGARRKAARLAKKRGLCVREGRLSYENEMFKYMKEEMERLFG